MKVIWLGQSGLLFVSGNKKIIVDPYLSDDFRKIDKNMSRGMKLNKKFFKVNPDIIVLTNSHPDHTDIKTLTSYFRKMNHPVTLLCSEAAYHKVEEAKISARYNNVMFCEGSEWTLENIRITAVKAQTDDKGAIGITISDALTNKIYYVASDTLYNKYVIESVPHSPDVSFIPINGEGGCMNIADAARFASAIGSKIVVPIHFGMFDMIDPNNFPAENKIIPKIYKILDFESMACGINPFKKAVGLTHKFEEPKAKNQKAAKPDKNGEETQHNIASDGIAEKNISGTVPAEESSSDKNSGKKNLIDEIKAEQEVSVEIRDGKQISAGESNFPEDGINEENISEKIDAYID